MKKVFLLSILMSYTFLVFAQTGSISGKVVDPIDQTSLIGANVVVKGTITGTTTDIDGNFKIGDLQPGQVTLEISFIGYKGKEIVAEIRSGETTDLGQIELNASSLGLEEVEIIASIARDRETPVAFSNIEGETIESRIGNQEYPEILRNTPSIYVTKEGGGFGDSRINVRGFNQRNVAVMINGVPVNDMENGWVYWSNWAGLSDVTSDLQVQRGLGASKLAVASVGGSINIITNAAEIEQKTVASVSFGNDGYQKYSLAYSTGLGDNGWALTVQGTHTLGDGYVDGTMFRAYSYFASLSKVFDDGNQTLAFTALGAPQWHHQRLVDEYDGVSLRTFVDPDDTGDPFTDMGIKYNHLWGTYKGDEYSWRKNFYHKPMAFLNHYWTISNKTELSTSAYISFGRGGGTGPRGRINGSFDTDSKFRAQTNAEYDQNGSVRWEDIEDWNQGQDVPDFGDPKMTWDEYTATQSDIPDGIDNRKGYFADKYVNTSSYGFVRRASMNSHNWYGVLSTLTHEFNSRLNLVAGIDARYYKGIHYRRMDDLLGADAYFTNTNINNAGNFITQEKESSAVASLQNDQILNYYNDGLVNWAGVFGQLEYSTDKLSTFISLSGSNQGFKRVDYFNYLDGDDTEADGNPKQKSDWENFLGGTVKAGALYNINKRHNVFLNAGFYSQQPIFDNVFINFVNDVNDEVVNQKVYALEGGYGYTSQFLNLNFNAYYTLWDDRQFDKDVEFEDGSEGLATFSGVSQLHRGVELELTSSPIEKLTINGMASLGKWEYNDNFKADVTNIDTQEDMGSVTIFADGLKVGDAAQTTLSLGASYEIIRGLEVYADSYYANNLYAEYDINDKQFTQEGGEVAKLPSYTLFDAGASYFFTLANIDFTLRVNVNNVFDKEYIAELDTNIKDDPETDNYNEFYDNRGFYGFGRTWNTTLKIKF